MERICLTLQYDGSAYHGFQKQENAYTIQEAVEKAIAKLTGEQVSLVCAGRTDSGVHALGQVVAFNSEATIPGERWKLALNSLLPADIQVVESRFVNASFNPRFDAISKEYNYRIYQQEAGKVCQRSYALCIQESLDLERMQKASLLLVGRNNFKAFCASGSSAKTFERNLTVCTVSKKGSFLVIKVEADGFLYNMVRIITGTLLEIGRGKYPPVRMSELLVSRDRTQAGPTAPPQGLYLVRVHYPGFVSDSI